jgi:hypothetical protein
MKYSLNDYIAPWDFDLETQRFSIKTKQQNGSWPENRIDCSETNIQKYNHVHFIAVCEIKYKLQKGYNLKNLILILKTIGQLQNPTNKT